MAYTPPSTGVRGRVHPDNEWKYCCWWLLWWRTSGGNELQEEAIVKSFVINAHNLIGVLEKLMKRRGKITPRFLRQNDVGTRHSKHQINRDENLQVKVDHDSLKRKNIIGV